MKHRIPLALLLTLLGVMISNATAQPIHDAVKNRDTAKVRELLAANPKTAGIGVSP